MKKKVIAVTDCSKYDVYSNWIRSNDQIETVKIGYHDDSISLLEKCDAVLLTGGEDVHPRFYNKAEYLRYCNEYDMNEQRDYVEFKVIEHAQHFRKPLLGICRGLQVANVFFGGTLIPDIPSFGKFNHSKHEGSDRYHQVKVDPTSFFSQIIGGVEGEVNSAHHQSAEIVAPLLVSNAISGDGVVEGLEWKDPAGKPYLLLVQWHPERMRDQNSAFSKNVRESFINAIKSGE